MIFMLLHERVRASSWTQIYEKSIMFLWSGLKSLK